MINLVPFASNTSPCSFHSFVFHQILLPNTPTLSISPLLYSKYTFSPSLCRRSFQLMHLCHLAFWFLQQSNFFLFEKQIASFLFHVFLMQKKQKHPVTAGDLSQWSAGAANALLARPEPLLEPSNEPILSQGRVWCLTQASGWGGRCR